MLINREHLPTASVFIDVPNVERGRVRFSAASWLKLTSFIVQADLHDIDPARIDATAYLRAHSEGSDFIHKASSMFASLHVDTMIRTDKDIDSLIVNGLWRAIVSHERASRSGGRIYYPLQVRLVVVSGDNDYLLPIKDLKKLYGEDLELDLRVYGWRGHTGEELQRAATAVTYLNDVPGFSPMPRRHALNNS